MSLREEVEEVKMIKVEACRGEIMESGEVSIRAKVRKSVIFMDNGAAQLKVKMRLGSKNKLGFYLDIVVHLEDNMAEELIKSASKIK